MMLSKKDWILLALLRHRPLDRIHIMKTLFLIWHRSGRRVADFFDFEPYLYGPCSFEVYSVLGNLQTSGLVVQPPHPVPQWANYYLTDRGEKEAEAARRRASSHMLTLIERVVDEVSGLSFAELLGKVYAEAPDFAANSIFREVV